MKDASAPRNRRARLTLKYAFITVASATLLLFAAAAYFIATFDAMDYQDRIVRLVNEKTGRTLHIEGGIALSFWPAVGLRISNVSLSERASDQAFASVESAHVTLELLPLLSREIVASRFVLTGARVHVVRYEDGRLNVDDLLGGEGPAPQFDLREMRVERSRLSYTDRRANTGYELTDLTFYAPRLANVVQTPVSAAFTARDANGAFAVRTNVKGRLALDLEARRHAVHGAVMEVDGTIPGMRHVAARVKGDLVARLDMREVEVSAFTCSLSGKVRDEELTMTLDAARLVARANRARGETLRMAVELRGTAGTTIVKLALPVATREDDWVRTREAAVDLALMLGEHHIRAAVTAGLEADVAARTVGLMDMVSKFNVSGPGLPRQGIAGRATGEGRIDALRESVQLALTGGIGGSKVQARVKASGFAAPIYAFDVSIDELDADRYTRNLVESRRKAIPGSEGASLLEPLAQSRATGTVTVGLLKSAGVSARNVRFEMK